MSNRVRGNLYLGGYCYVGCPDDNADTLHDMRFYNSGSDAIIFEYCSGASVTKGEGTWTTFNFEDILSLKINQIPQQPITGNLLTYANGHPDYTSGSHELVDMEQVEKMVASLNADYFLLDTASGIGTYKLTSLDPSPDAETYVEGASLSDNDEIQGFISPVGATLTELIAGVYDLHIHVEKMSGTKTLRLFWELIEYKADTTEVIIGTSDTNGEITSLAGLDYHLTLTTNYTITAGSRIVGKIRAEVTGSGLAPTVRIYYRGDTSSKWTIPTNIAILRNTFALKDLSNTDISTLTEETTPVTGMIMFIQLADGTVKKIDYSNVGGGGGHAILDKDGNPVTVRANLKFYQELSDNGTDTTIVLPKFKTVYFNAIYDNGNSGAAKTIDWNNGQNQKLTITADTVLTFTDIASAIYRVELTLIQDGTGGFTVTFPANVKWFMYPGFVYAIGTANQQQIITLSFDGTNYRSQCTFWTII